MEDFTFYQKFFVELNHCNLDTTKNTFNSYKIDNLSEYKKKLWSSYNNFENELDKILLISNLNKEHLFNLLNSRLTVVKEDFLKRYQRVEKAYSIHKAKNIPLVKTKKKTDLSIKLDILTLTKSFMDYHIDLIKRTEICIKSKIGALSGISIKDTSSQIIENQKIITNKYSENSFILEPPEEKLILNLSKKEIALFFTLLHEIGIIKVKGKKELYDFIQNNFKYIDCTGKNSKISNIKNINTEFSRLTDSQALKTNNKFREKIIDKYQQRIDEYIEKFHSVKLEDFRKL